MYTGKVTYEEDPGTGFSAQVWRDIDLTHVDDPTYCNAIIENFSQPLVLATATPQGGWDSFLDTGATAQGVATLPGIFRLSTSATDNDTAGIESGSGVAGLFKIDSSSPVGHLAFEVRLKISAITDNAGFVGLTEEGFVVNNCLTDDDGDLVDKDYLGFHWDTAASSTVDFVHNKASTTQTVAIAGVHTLVAATYVKLGFRYVPTGTSNGQVTAFVNGAANTTTVDDVSAAAFPDGEEMSISAVVKTGSATDITLDMDWIACVQRL